jgi:hypothetical protein
MDDELETWSSCGQIETGNGFLLTFLCLNGGTLRCIDISTESMTLQIELTDEQAQDLSRFVIGSPLEEKS